MLVSLVCELVVSVMIVFCVIGVCVCLLSLFVILFLCIMSM